MMSNLENSRRSRPFSEPERRYGYFRCSLCHTKWETENVYCQKGPFMDLSKQPCESCKTMTGPYMMTDIEWELDSIEEELFAENQNRTQLEDALDEGLKLTEYNQSRREEDKAQNKLSKKCHFKRRKRRREQQMQDKAKKKQERYKGFSCFVKGPPWNRQIVKRRRRKDISSYEDTSFYE